MTVELVEPVGGTVQVAVPHAGPGTHTLVVAIEVGNRPLADDDQLLDRLCARFRAEAARAIAEYRHQDELEEFLHRCRFSLADLRAYDLRPAVNDARQELMYRLHMAGWSYPRIGRLLHRDHSTIIHGVRSWVGRSAMDRARQQWQVSA